MVQVVHTAKTPLKTGKKGVPLRKIKWYICGTFFSASPETPLKTGKKGVPLLIFDVLGDAEKDGLPFSRVPVLKIFLGVFPLIYGRK